MNLEFTEKITNHYVNLRCIPADNSWQYIYGSNISIFTEAENTPMIKSGRLYGSADSITEKKDSQGNIMISCCIKNFHDKFHVISEGVAFTDITKPQYGTNNEVYRMFTPITYMDEYMEEAFITYSNKYWEDKKSNWDNIYKFMNYLYENMDYISGVTNTCTKAFEAFRLKKGVCQDYAHILIAFCRYKGIQARYVSGFVCGEGATHAWVEIMDNGIWYGFDPTYNITITNNYIKIAHGRDSTDCPMEKGVFRGNGCQKQIVNVVVREHVDMDGR